MKGHRSSAVYYICLLLVCLICFAVAGRIITTMPKGGTEVTNFNDQELPTLPLTIHASPGQQVRGHTFSLYQVKEYTGYSVKDGVPQTTDELKPSKVTELIGQAVTKVDPESFGLSKQPLFSSASPVQEVAIDALFSDDFRSQWSLCGNWEEFDLRERILRSVNTVIADQESKGAIQPQLQVKGSGDTLTVRVEAGAYLIMDDGGGPLFTETGLISPRVTEGAGVGHVFTRPAPTAETRPFVFTDSMTSCVNPDDSSAVIPVETDDRKIWDLEAIAKFPGDALTTSWLLDVDLVGFTLPRDQDVDVDVRSSNEQDSNHVLPTIYAKPDADGHIKLDLTKLLDDVVGGPISLRIWFKSDILDKEADPALRLDSTIVRSDGTQETTKAVRVFHRASAKLQFTMTNNRGGREHLPVVLRLKDDRGLWMVWHEQSERWTRSTDERDATAFTTDGKDEGSYHCLFLPRLPAGHYQAVQDIQARDGDALSVDLALKVGDRGELLSAKRSAGTGGVDYHAGSSQEVTVENHNTLWQAGWGLVLYLTVILVVCGFLAYLILPALYRCVKEIVLIFHTPADSGAGGPIGGERPDS